MPARHRLLLPASAIMFALSACGSAAAPGPTSAAPTSAAPTSAAPTSAAPADEGIGSASGTRGRPDSAARQAPAATKKPASAQDAGAGCPSATVLERLADLPKDWHFTKVECAQNWAATSPEGPGVGDGLYLFKYRAGAGWRYHGQGSGLDCKKDLGLTKPAPFCAS